MSPQPRRSAPQQKTFVRANHRIRVPQVRCVGADGTMLGVIATREAMRLAGQQELDLVEISPNADPPVCRIMDFGKFRYDESIKRRKARRQAALHSRPVKEIKFHANVADHDYQTKLGHARGFLEKGHKVKVSLTFRGRENAHRELGFEVVKRVIADCEDLCAVEMQPKLMGRNLVCMLGVKAPKT